MQKILVLDCDGICWQVFHSMPPLSHEEKGTSVIYGFLNHVFELNKFEKPDHIVFAWDSVRSHRRKIFPEYKSGRILAKEKYTDEEKVLHKDRVRQFKVLRKKIIPQLGFSNSFMETGFEGDDIIASIALEHRGNSKVRIIARDGDLFQLLDDNCTMFDLVKRQVIDDEVFFEKYGIYPDMWADVKGIAGCPTDGVPGVYNIGYDRAIQYLLGKMKFSSKLYQRIKGSPELIELTRKLTVLPFEGTPSYPLEEDTCSVKNFKMVARKYGLQSYLSRDRIKNFKEDFCGTNKGRP